MDGKKIRILALFAAILSLCGNAAAQAGYVLFQVLSPIIEELWKWVARWWIISSGGTATEFLEAIFDNMESLLTESPPMSAITPEMWFFIRIIIPFYILAIVILAVYISMASSSVRGRAKAKSMLVKLTMGLILVSISPWILEVLFLISENLAGALMGMGATEGIDTLKDTSSGLHGVFAGLGMIHRTGGVEIFALHIALLLGLVSLLLIRQVMVILFGILLPLAFLLYSFHPTKHIGKDLFIQTFLWTFTPVAWTLALVIIGIGRSTMLSYIPELYILIGAFFFFLGSPMLIMGVGEWLVFLVFLFEVLQAAPLSIGAVVIDETMK